MKKLSLALIVVLFASFPVIASEAVPTRHVPVRNTFWYAVDATDADLCATPPVASFPSSDSSRPHVAIAKVVGDFVAIPDTPYTVEIFRSLEHAMETIFYERRRGGLVGFVTGGDGATYVVLWKFGYPR